MTTHRGFAAITAVIAVLGLIVIGGAGYLTFHPETFEKAFAPKESTETATTTTEGSDDARKGKDKWIEVDSSTSISWKFTTLPERDHIPYTKVDVMVNGKNYEAGEFQGSCSELGANGGIDGKGLVAGELSAVQCYFAGAGDEIGVFAHEDGGYQIMIGEIEEPIEGGAGFRGNFKIKTDIHI